MNKPAVLFISAAIVLCACSPSVKGLLKSCTPDAQIDVQTDAQTEVQTDAQSDMQSDAQSDANIVDTKYYTISPPASWGEDYIYSLNVSAAGAYSLSFYHAASNKAAVGGLLLNINLIDISEDYSYYPDYELLGTLEVDVKDRYNIVVTYPTDVQFTEETARKYQEMFGDIPALLESVEFKDGCVFSE